MTPSIFSKKSRVSKALLTLAGFSLLAGAADAQTSGDWNVNANGNWSATGSWLGGVIPNGAGGTANFNFDITADRVVTIDTTPRVIGNLLFRDGALGSHAYILGAIASTNVFTLNNNASKPRITLYPRAANVLDAGWEWRSFRTDDTIVTDPRDYIRLNFAIAP